MIDVTDDNKIYYYHFDGLRSVVALSDSSANIVERYSYDVFGGILVTVGLLKKSHKIFFSQLSSKPQDFSAI